MSSKTMKNAMAVGVAAVVGVAGAFAIVTASQAWAAADCAECGHSESSGVNPSNRCTLLPSWLRSS